MKPSTATASLSSKGTGAIDVLREPCPHARVATALPLALIEELDRRRGALSRAGYLAQVLDAAMTRSEPHLPAVGQGQDMIDASAARRYRQHVRSIEVARGQRIGGDHGAPRLSAGQTGAGPSLGR